MGLHFLDFALKLDALPVFKSEVVCFRFYDQHGFALVLEPSEFEFSFFFLHIFPELV